MHAQFWVKHQPLVTRFLVDMATATSFLSHIDSRGCGFDARVQKVGPIALGEYGSTRRCPRLEMRGSLNGGSSAATRRPWPGPSPGHHYFAIRNRHAVAHCKLSGGAPIARAQIRGESAAEPGFSDPSVEQTRGRGRGASQMSAGLALRHRWRGKTSPNPATAGSAAGLWTTKTQTGRRGAPRSRQ